MPDNVDDYVNPLGQLAALFTTRSSIVNSNVNYVALKMTTATEVVTPIAPITPSTPATHTAPIAPSTPTTPATLATRVIETVDRWSRAPGTSWQIQLQGTLDTSLNVDMYDIDLFDTPVSVIGV